MCGPWFVVPDSPWPVPFPPPPPQTVAHHCPCSEASLVLWDGPTSHGCSSPSCSLRIHGTGRLTFMTANHGISRLPRNVLRCAHGVYDRAGSGSHLALAVPPVLPLAYLDSGGTLKCWGQFHGSIPGSHLPLSTLHPCPHGHRRMTRGQSGSLTLPCIGLPPTTHLRLSTAHQDATPSHSLGCVP